jgi:hypothetical protein
MTTATANQDNESRPLPVWMSIPIILLCLAGGGYIIHWYVMSDPLSHEVKLLGDPPAGRQWGGNGGVGRNAGGPNFNQPQQQQQRRFVRDRGNNRWEVRTEQARMEVSVANAKSNVAVITYIGNYAFVPEETRTTIIAARMIISDADRVTALKLPADSVKKLKGLTTTITMNAADADKKELVALMQAYVQSPEAQRTAQETKIYQTLDQIAQRSQGPTRQLATERAAQINSLITPDQWKLNATMGGK